MELGAATVELYLRHAFGAMVRVVERLDDELVMTRPPVWGTNTIAGLVVHCCELAPWWLEMPGLGREVGRDRDAEFVAEATVAELVERIEAAVERSCRLAAEFAAGPTATDHPIREFLPGSDRGDGALVLHVIEELFQHLGHMEVAADALLGGR